MDDIVANGVDGVRTARIAAATGESVAQPSSTSGQPAGIAATGVLIAARRRPALRRVVSRDLSGWIDRAVDPATDPADRTRAELVAVTMHAFDRDIRMAAGKPSF